MKKTIHRFVQQCVCRFGIDKVASCLGLWEPKIVSWLDGGLGSQMWQFSLGYAVSQKTGLPLYLKTDFFDADGCDIKGNPNRKFLLMEAFPEIRERYGNHLLQLGEDSLFLSLFSDWSKKRSFYDYDSELFCRKSQYLTQYYCNASYISDFQKELQGLFRFDVPLSEYERDLEQAICSSPHGCSVHIRKGDFVGSVHDVCSDSYYLRAIDYIKSQFPDVEFYIFSNDEQYVEQLCRKVHAKVTMLNQRSEVDPRADLYLLTLCRHSIISNSGFSWMASFLKCRDGVTIMPDKWTRIEGFEKCSSDAFKLKSWLQFSA